jgi:hypothetical protein
VTLHTVETLLVVHAQQTITITLTAHVCPSPFKFHIFFSNYNYADCLVSITCSGYGNCTSIGTCDCDTAHSGNSSCGTCAMNYYHYPDCTCMSPPPPFKFHIFSLIITTQTVWQAQHAVDMEIAVPQELVIVTLHTVETLLVGHAQQIITITLTANVYESIFFPLCFWCLIGFLLSFLLCYLWVF